jgi:hypothetical protein
MKFEAGAILRTAHKSRYFTIDGQPFVVDGISDISGYVKMGFTLWKLFEAVLLCLNAVCVLHEERFLARSKNFMPSCWQEYKKISLRKSF